MGFKDATWAYGLDLPLRETVVLAAYALRTDDTTHSTFVGQATVAEMIGSSTDYVGSAVKELARLGVIGRQRRNNAGGYRTSDLIVLNLTYTAPSQVGPEPSRPATNQADSGDLTRSRRSPNPLTAGAIEIIQIDHSEDHPVLSSDTAIAAPRPEIEALLDLLDAEIIRNGGRPPSRTRKNRDAIRLMVDRDGRTVEQIENAIRWCQADEFWRSNILSAAKLREKYDQLRLAAQRQVQRPSTRPTPEQRARQTFADLSGDSPLSIDPPRETNQ